MPAARPSLPDHQPRPSLLVVRHPLSSFNLEGRWAGWADPPLAEEGWRQCEEASRLWDVVKPDRVVSSDLLRASDAASLLAGRLRAPHTVEPAWRERNAGLWQSRLLEDVSRDPQYQRWREDPRVCPPDGEPYRMFADRLLGQVSRLRAGPLLTLVVAHSGVLSVLASELAAEGAGLWRPRSLLDALAVASDGSAWFFSADEGTGSGGIPSSAGHGRVPPPSSSESAALPDGCFSCLRQDRSLTVWESPLSRLSHTADEGREGWFILAPRRHVRSFQDLTFAESDEMLLIIRAVDRVLAELFGSRRTLVASLGWFVSDHLHVHLVPTFRAEVSYGSLNFDGAFVPWAGDRAGAVRLMAAALAADPGLGRLR